MKLAAILASLLAPSAAFSPGTARRGHAPVGCRQIPTHPSTALRSMIFEPPVDENCELDGSNCEESIFDRKRRERAEADDAIRERYRTERGIELSEVDLMESIDQYQNAPTGGNLIPGVTLTALCGDD
ncbi:hypothetical protein ACHAXT_000042 [Thalassiosira profunda]